VDGDVYCIEVAEIIVSQSATNCSPLIRTFRSSSTKHTWVMYCL